MKQQHPADHDHHPAPFADHRGLVTAPGVAVQRLSLVNVILASTPNASPSPWVLIDTGVPGAAREIIETAHLHFRDRSRPAAIIMTHSHPDHTGSLRVLAESWNVPVYAHQLEMPYLNGTSQHPSPDPDIGNGAMRTLARLHPSGPLDVGEWLLPLPADGTVPDMPGWRWIHTPGHTAGHISLWRESDRTLIAGDAVLGTDQASVYSLEVQKPLLSGPPRYFTSDWNAARASVEHLSRLKPQLVIAGHGPAIRGPGLERSLRRVAAALAMSS